MNALFRCLLVCSIAVLPAAAHAHDHGKREYRETGYYQWDAYKCKWIWYAYAKQAYGTYDNHSTTLHMTVNNFQGAAKRGETGYATREVGYEYGPKLDPNATINMAKELLLVAHRGASDGFNQAMAFASQQGANDVELAKEITQVRKLESLPLILESSKAQSSSTYVREYSGHATSEEGNVSRPAPVPVQGDLAAVETKCMECHRDGQKGGGVKLKPLAEFPAVQADLALEYITSIRGNNCSKRADLSDAEHKQLVKFFAKKANQ